MRFQCPLCALITLPKSIELTTGEAIQVDDNNAIRLNGARLTVPIVAILSCISWRGPFARK